MDKALKTIPMLDADYMQNKIVENRLSRTVRVYKGNRFDKLRSEQVLL
jgi:hypothetical protein